MQLLGGKLVSEYLLQDIKNQLNTFDKKKLRKPHLCVILVGNNPASESYVRNKARTCEEMGILSTVIRYEVTVSEDDLLNKIEEINCADSVDGLLVQLPLPAHIQVDKILESIRVDKDVDGFHPENIGKMVKGLPSFVPATPMGILEIIKYYKIPTEGKYCVVIGRSQLVGLPISILLSRKGYPGNCTVTLSHSFTPDIENYTKHADIIIAAIGIPKFVSADMVKKGAIVIDVGISRVADDSKKSGYRLVGDVDFKNVAPKCSYITTVPGGVGLMTIACLMQNTLQAYKIHNQLI